MAIVCKENSNKRSYKETANTKQIKFERKDTMEVVASVHTIERNSDNSRVFDKEMKF